MGGVLANQSWTRGLIAAALVVPNREAHNKGMRSMLRRKSEMEIKIQESTVKVEENPQFIS